MILFRRVLMDVPVFLTAALIIILLNAGQYFIGYGGVGFVDDVSPTGLTLGFPFRYYYFSFSVYEGAVIYLGLLGNLIFAAGLGAIEGVIAALVKTEVVRARS